MTVAADNQTTATAKAFYKGEIDKWEAYGTIFDLVDRRRITLKRAADILIATGASGDLRVVKMRRRDYLAMKGRKS